MVDLTYQDVMRADFSSLTAAAKQWRAMGDAFDALRQDYANQVRNKAKGWSGEAAKSFWTASDTALYEFGAAKTQAHSIAKLLDNGHDMLTEAREVVKRARSTAEDKGGMKVDAYGKCTTDISKLTAEEAQGVLRDPTRLDTERAWTNWIQRAVQGVVAADRLVRAALESAGTDADARGDLNGFNGKAPSGLEEFARQEAALQAAKAAEKAEKKKADDLSRKITKGTLVGLYLFLRSGGDLGKFAASSINAVAEATGYNKTQGICLNFSAGAGIGGSLDTCLIATRRPDGGVQLSSTFSPAAQTEGWDFGVGASIGVLKSNADDISQIRGGGWDKGGSVKSGPLGVDFNRSDAFGAKNSKGDSVSSYFLGVGPGAEGKIGTGFSRTYGNVLWESPPQRGSK
ncbi:WXG100 family type VII secretion target [Streptomyces boncukensis]|uniref:Uncharacterized protein n=1 Tax=Streptomyces boncukensis TaxID=2711219 RepID=A0A6G4X6P1_9ACTN|nr:hypothetical protein [Streptomyces boncukensis]NGO73185.1 hypothetical protein [Streptomyces boncukensis]